MTDEQLVWSLKNAAIIFGVTPEGKGESLALEAVKKAEAALLERLRELREGR